MEEYLKDIKEEVKKYQGEELGKLLRNVLNSSIFYERLRVHIFCSENDKWYSSLTIFNESDLDKIENPTLLNSKIIRVEPLNQRTYKIDIEKNYEQEILFEREKLSDLEVRYKKLMEEKTKILDELESLETGNKILKTKNKKLREQLGLIEKEKIEEKNSYGFFNAEYCRSTGKPMFKNKKEYEPFSKHFLSKSRCNKIKQPVKDGEYIFAFYRCQNGYAPLYYRENE